MLKTSCCNQDHECSQCDTYLDLVFPAASEQSDFEYPRLPSDDSFQSAPLGLSGMQTTWTPGLTKGSFKTTPGATPGCFSEQFDDQPKEDSTKRAFGMLTMPSPEGQLVMRSVSLRKTLGRAREFWLSSPRARSQQQKERLFQASAPATDFKMFLSHTWKTKGEWKFISLLLQFGWPDILACWICMVILAVGLCMAEILPLFNTYETHAVGFDGVVPSGCWVQVFGLLGILVGCILFPHLPCYESDQCFLDYVCIHQTDSSEMQQGIRSISAFLAASEELRVLWSAPLLSRLWCVFEIAAYRKLNPSGRIVLAPLNNEISACLIFFWFQISMISFWFARSGPDGGNPIAVLLVIAVFSVGFVPGVADAIWRSHQSGTKLRHELANFDVANVNCSSDFDRECIHHAITTWYGSLEAFSEHVRGPFSQEVLKLMGVGGSVSPHYVFLAMTPIVCLSMDNVVALTKGGAPPKAVITIFFNHVVALILVFLPALAIFITWIARKGLWMGRRRCQPLGLEIAVILTLAFILFATATFTAIVISARSLQMTVLWNCSAFLFAGIVWLCCWRGEPA